jgi:hypothetical protein
MDEGEQNAFIRALDAFPLVRSSTWRNIPSSEWWKAHQAQTESPPSQVKVDDSKIESKTVEPPTTQPVAASTQYPSEFFPALLKYLIVSGMSQPDAMKTVTTFKSRMEQTIASLSLDDIERIAARLPE